MVSPNTVTHAFSKTLRVDSLEVAVIISSGRRPDFWSAHASSRRFGLGRARSKAMQGCIALLKHFVQNLLRTSLRPQGLGRGVGRGLGAGVPLGVGVGRGVTVGVGVAVGVAVGVGLAVGVGVGVPFPPGP
jgi:hypothetical protein